MYKDLIKKALLESKQKRLEELEEQQIINDTLSEQIKGWKHAHADLNKIRRDKANKNRVRLVSVKADGSDSKMHDATTYHDSEEHAIAHHERVKKLNPNRKIRHALYVNGERRILGEEEEIVMAEARKLTPAQYAKLSAAERKAYKASISATVAKKKATTASNKAIGAKKADASRGVKPVAKAEAKPAKVKHTPAGKPEEDEEQSRNSRILKGDFPHGKYNPRPILSALRMIEKPKDRLKAMDDIWNSKEALHKLIGIK